MRPGHLQLPENKYIACVSRKSTPNRYFFPDLFLAKPINSAAHTGYGSHWLRLTQATAHTGYGSHWLRLTLATAHKGCGSHWLRLTLATAHTGCGSQATAHTGYGSHWLQLTKVAAHTGCGSHRLSHSRQQFVALFSLSDFPESLKL